MLLKKLLIENLRSYEKQEIAFPKGSVLLSGDIGAGKTTILLAIEFALFGLQPGQKGTSLLRTQSDTGRVILEFEIQGKEIIIERTLKRSSKSVSQDYAVITIDREKYEGSVTEIKSKILKLLNYPSEFAKKTNLLYKFTVYTPQEEMKQIILEPGELRLNTLRHVFGIDKYKRVQENAALLTSRLREKIRINEGMIYDLEEHKEIVRQKKENIINLKEKQEHSIKMYENTVSEREAKEQLIKEVQEKIEEKKALENEKSKSNILISEKTQQIASLQSSIESLRLQVEEAKKISFNEEEFLGIDDRIKFQESKENELQKEYIGIISRINSHESKRRETDSLKNKISLMEKCPTCLQEVSDTYKKNIFERTEEEIATIQKKLNELAARKNHLTEQIESVKKKKEDFKKRKSELELLKIKLENQKEKEQRIVEVETQKKKIEQDLLMLRKHVETIEKSILDFGKYDLVYKLREKELQDIKAREHESAIKKVEINKEIQFLEEQIKEKQFEIQKKEDIKKKTERIREIEYWISERFLNLVLSTERQVMLTLKDEFSKLFSRWFAMLVSDSLSAKLDDSFSPIIEHQDYELDYQFLSGGERTAVALAYRLALNQVINSMLSNIRTNDIVILDEPTDGFSEQQLDKMRDVLSQLEVSQLILVSHEQKIEGFVDNIIRLRKQYGVTGIERH
jgi:exonuclease SbcC